MKKQYNKYIELDEAQVLVENGAICIPISVQHDNLDKYHGDARSFGYNFDDGYCTTITYQVAVGALAEDTLDLLVVFEGIEKRLRRPDFYALEQDVNQESFDLNKAELIIESDDKYLYMYNNSYFMHDARIDKDYVKVTYESAIEYIADNKEYKDNLYKYSITSFEIGRNVNQLKEIFKNG